MKEIANAKCQHVKSSAVFAPFKMADKKDKKVLLRNDIKWRSNFYIVQNHVHPFFYYYVQFWSSVPWDSEVKVLTSNKNISGI